MAQSDVSKDEGAVPSPPTFFQTNKPMLRQKLIIKKIPRIRLDKGRKVYLNDPKRTAEIVQRGEEQSVIRFDATQREMVVCNSWLHYVGEGQ